MNTGLTPTIAAELGKNLKFLRHATDKTLADVAREANISISYLQNLEGGARTNADEDRYLALAKGLGIDRQVMQDLILRARILSALELRGLSPTDSTFVWRGVEQRMGEVGIKLQTDLTRVISDLLGNGR